MGATLLEGISLSQPQPKIPAEMIKYMGRHFHAWHTAISMLESHVGLFPGDMRCFDAVCELYKWVGVWVLGLGSPSTQPQHLGLHRIASGAAPGQLVWPPVVSVHSVIPDAIPAATCICVPLAPGWGQTPDVRQAHPTPT